MDYRERYRNGEHRQVTAELTRLDPREGDACMQMRAVAELAMARVAHNCRLLVQRLTAHGYAYSVYCDPDDDGGVSAPLLDADAVAPAMLKARIGALPVTLECFWQAMGGIALTGTHPAFPDMLDPLLIYPAEALLEASDEAEREDDGLFHLALSPDDYHKDNVSGGASYAVALPQDGFDFVLLYEAREAYFLDYLRDVILHRGGFGALDTQAAGGVPLSALTEGLLPF